MKMGDYAIVHESIVNGTKSLIKECKSISSDLLLLVVSDTPFDTWQQKHIGIFEGSRQSSCAAAPWPWTWSSQTCQGLGRKQHQMWRPHGRNLLLLAWSIWGKEITSLESKCILALAKINWPTVPTSPQFDSLLLPLLAFYLSSHFGVEGVVECRG